MLLVLMLMVLLLLLTQIMLITLSHVDWDINYIMVIMTMVLVTPAMTVTRALCI